MQEEDLKADTTRVAPSILDPYVAEPPRKITEEERNFKAYRTLRVARANARYEGARKVRAAKVRFLVSNLPIYSQASRNSGRRRRQQEKSNAYTVYIMYFPAFQYHDARPHTSAFIICVKPSI